MTQTPLEGYKERSGYAPKSNQAQVQNGDEPYLKQDFNGKELYIASLMNTQSQADMLIGLVSALKPLLPEG